MNAKIKNFSLAIFEKINEAALDSHDLLYSILISGYGASLGKIMRNQERKQRERVRISIQAQERKKFHSALYKLKKEGFIEIDAEKKLHITPKGIEKFKKISIKRFGSNFQTL